MYKLLIIALFTGIILGSCSDSSSTTDCEARACTKEFRVITLKFVDANANPQTVRDFKVINNRTGEILIPPNDMTIQGVYVVASDSDLLKLSEKGDNVQVTAIDSKTNAKIQVDFVISGGVCSCHVIKISGPEIVQI